MTAWPGNGVTNWNDAMAAAFDTEHDKTDGTHKLSVMGWDPAAIGTPAAESNGFCVFPNGVRIAWGDNTVTSSETIDVSAVDSGWTITFQAYAILGIDGAQQVSVHNIVGTEFDIAKDSAVEQRIRWFAIGR